MIAILFGMVMTIAHYVSESLSSSLQDRRLKLLSFSGGVSLAYIFLELLPASYDAVPHLHRILFFLMLAGFCIFYLAEKHLYRHQSSKRESELTKTHLYAFFLYHFFLGLVLAHMTSTTFLRGLLFFFPLLIHTMASTASLNEVHPRFKEHPFAKSLLANSSLLGVLFAIFFPLSPVTYYALLSFIIGVLLYVVIRDLLPEDEGGSPAYFVMGILLYSLLLLFA
jgi:zinc transporter ZupT